MKCPHLGRFPRAAALALLACLGAASAVAQQSPASPSSASTALATVNDSLQELKTQVRQLDTALSEMRDEVARSRREAQELSRELQSTREQLASFRQALAAPREEAAAGRASTLDQRVATMEENQQLLTAKVEDQYQTKVESGSKYRVRLSGIALLNLFSTRGSVDDLDFPTIAQPRSSIDSGGSFGATVRQSRLGVEVFGPTLAGAKTSGDIQFDFFGGFPNSVDGVTAGLVRLRTAKVSFDWKTTSIVAGQDVLFFSPLSPSSLASLAYPAFSYSGNLWRWTPQVRVEHRMTLPNDSSVLVQGGILDALSGEAPAYPQYSRLPQAGERARGPAYAARAAWTRTMHDRPITVGAGTYFARQDWGLGRMVNAWAATADWELPLGRWFSLTGEFYRGRSLGGLGGGAGSSVLFGTTTAAVKGVDSSGGWSQLKFMPLEKIEFNGAFGEDYPFASHDYRFSQSQSYLGSAIGRNASAFANAIYHARSNLLFSVEYRRLWTSQIYGAKLTADQLNVGAGVLF